MTSVMSGRLQVKNQFSLRLPDLIIIHQPKCMEGIQTRKIHAIAA